MSILRWFHSIYLYFTLMHVVDYHENIYKTVEIKNGAVRGIMNKTILNQKDFYSFRGIPFAKPPLGELRFKVL